MCRYVQFLHALKHNFSPEIWLFLFFFGLISRRGQFSRTRCPSFCFGSPRSGDAEGRAASVDSVALPTHHLCSSRTYEFLSCFIFRRESENATPSLKDGKQLFILCQTAARWWYFFLLADPTLKFCVSQIDCKKAIWTVGVKKSMKRIISNVGISRKLTFALFSKVKENKGSEKPATASLSPKEHPEIKMVCFCCL